MAEVFPFYVNERGKIVVVDAGPYKAWTFYARTDVKTKGTRVRGRSGNRYWYNRRQDAVAALADLAQERGWPGFRRLDDALSVSRRIASRRIASRRIASRRIDGKASRPRAEELGPLFTQGRRTA